MSTYNGANKYELSGGTSGQGAHGSVPKRSRHKYLLLSTASLLALTIAATAHADITYTGSVSPTPPTGTNIWNSWGDLIIGNFNGGTGSLTVSGGSQIKGLSTITLVGTSQKNSLLTVTGNGSTVTTTGNINVGGSGYGLLVVADGATVTSGKDLQVGTDSAGLLNQSAGTVDVGGANSLLDVSHGTISLGGVSSFYNNQGTLTVHDGARVVTKDIVLGSGSGPVTAGVYGTLNIGLADTPGVVTANTVGNQRQDAHGTIVFNHTSSNYSFSPQIIGNTKVISRLGTTILSNVANSFNGGVELDGGEISVASDHVLGDAAGSLYFNGGMLKVTGTSFTSTARNISWGTNGGGFDIDDAGNSFTVTQNLTGGGPLTKTGAGTLVLAGTNTYAGGTTINGGTLSVNSMNKLGALSTGVTFNGGVLRVTGVNIPSMNDRTITWGANGGGFDVADAANTFTVSQNLINGGQLTKKGAGTLVLSGTNTYTGGTNINGGELSVSKDANLGASQGSLSFNGGILKVTETTFTSTSRAMNWGANGGGFDIDDAASTFTVSQNLTNGGQLTKAGAGKLIMTA